MATINNEHNYTLSPAQQQAVFNAAANMGIDEVFAGEQFEDEDVDLLFYIPFFDADGEFLFNLNCDTGKVE